MKYLFFSAALLFFNFLHAQDCVGPGQSPQRAFPVCGQNVFKQSSVPICEGKLIPAADCDNAAFTDKNPYWYSFTCYVSGALSFQIDPANDEDDYDWQLFDITGHDAGDVYKVPSLIIANNWSEVPGLTGCRPAAPGLFNCAGLTYPNFSTSPQIVTGHKYILLISHYTDTQSGYELSFINGKELITDPLLPQMAEITAACDAQTLYIKMNKQIRCNSLAANGSDFYINSSVASVASASGVNCSSAFDLDSVKIQLNKPLPPGDYMITVKKGADGNTLVDDCENFIPEGDSIVLKILPLAPTPLDSIVPFACASNTVQLYFKKNILCSSIAANGSDFVITGTDAGIKVAGASGICSNGSTPVINVTLNKPIQTEGSYTISLKKNLDGSTITDVCKQETPPASLTFLTADTVSAKFNYYVGLGCVYDTLLFAHDGRNKVNYWQWTIDTVATTGARDSVYLFTDYGLKTLSLSVSNGACTDTSTVSFALDNELKAVFYNQPAAELCPEDPLMVTDSSIGKIISHQWFYGDGTTSNTPTPAPKYYNRPGVRQGLIYPVTLIVRNDLNCFDTTIHQLKVLYNCYIAVPTAFSPNNDGINDYLYPLNAYKANKLVFRIYNRFGQVIFETRNWTNKWDGTINNQPQPAGTYVWTLSYVNADTGVPVSLKGTTVLIR